jgi:hypothetical protein
MVEIGTRFDSAESWMRLEINVIHSDSMDPVSNLMKFSLPPGIDEIEDDLERRCLGFRNGS